MDNRNKSFVVLKLYLKKTALICMHLTNVVSEIANNLVVDWTSN